MTEPMQPQKPRRVVGLDAHPTLFSAAALLGHDAHDAQVEWVVDRLPLERLEEILLQRTGPEDVIVLEASGNSFALADSLERGGRRVVVLESQSVGKVGKSYCATDRLDAVKLARVYFSGLAHPVWVPDEKTRARRELFFAHRNAVRDAVRARNRIWAWLNEHRLRRPSELRLSRPAALQSLLALHPWSPLQQVLLQDLLSTFQRSEARRVQFRALIAEEVCADPELLKLMRLLGVRHLVAFALAAFIGPVQRFASPKKLVAFFGLNPCVSRSGLGGGNGALSHYGRADVRALLIQAAHSILRYGAGPTHRWALALKMRKGASLAVAALARKLVVAIWYLLMGLFTPMGEASTTLRVKLAKTARDIGRKRLRQLGFPSVTAFQEEKIHVLTLTT